MTQGTAHSRAGAEALAAARRIAKANDEAEHKAAMKAVEGTMSELRKSGVFAREEARRREQAERERVERVANRVRTLARAGIALKHARVIAGELPYREPTPFATGIARRFGESGELLLCLLGSKGVGKTFGAAELVQQHGGHMVPSRLLRKHAWWCTKGPDQITGLTRQTLLTTTLLALDDLGQESEDDAAETVEIVDHLIELRTRAGLKFVITGNMRRASLQEVEAAARAKSAQERATVLAGTFEGYFGRRAETVLTRFAEYGAVVPCDGEDLRAEERAAKKAAKSRQREIEGT